MMQSGVREVNAFLAGGQRPRLSSPEEPALGAVEGADRMQPRHKPWLAEEED